MAELKATQQFSLNVVETEDTTDQPVGVDRTRSFNANARKRISAETGADAPGSLCIATRYTGSQSLDLTNFTGTLGAAQDASGLKVQAVLLRNNSSANDVTIEGGIANEYQLNAGVDKVIKPGGYWQEFFNDQLADVDATHKAIDITATAGQTFDLILVLG